MKLQSSLVIIRCVLANVCPFITKGCLDTKDYTVYLAISHLHGIDSSNTPAISESIIPFILCICAFLAFLSYKPHLLAIQ